MQNRRLIITVPADKYRVLSVQARNAVRSPEQQAAFIVRSWLAQDDQASATDRQPSEAAS